MTSMDREVDLVSLEKALGRVFVDRGLLRLALTHRSCPPPHNERLEFLGDSMLDLATADLLYTAFPDAREGDLSQWRAALVNTVSLARLARGLGLGAVMELAKGERLSGGEEKDSILANALEAVLGAVYLDGGYAAAFGAVNVLLGPLIGEIRPGHSEKDFKTLLQELLQGRGLPLPDYRVAHESGPAHERLFHVACQTPEMAPTEGVGRSKRAAEQNAARAALEILQGRDS